MGRLAFYARVFHKHSIFARDAMAKADKEDHPVAVIIFNHFNEKSSLSEEFLPPICSHDQVFY